MRPHLVILLSIAGLLAAQPVPAQPAKPAQPKPAAPASERPLPTLNIIACPSCSRVENQAFIELAQQVKELTRYAKEHAITIAVMGCRVNGPGETDDADLGLWCGPSYVNLKRGSAELGAYPYDQILGRLKTELDVLISQRVHA